MGIFDYPPYFLRDKASGEWVGAMVEMAKDIAKELDVKLEMVEVGGFAESVLSLQANKVDMNFGLQATPKRATAIDFAGPTYWIEWVTVNNPKFHGKVWADYNSPDVKVAVMTGTSDSLLLSKMAPKVTKVEMQDIAQVALAVSSGRADAFVMDDNILAGLIVNAKTPADFKIVGESLSEEPIAIMIPKDDPAYKKLVDDTVIGLMKSGELDKIYTKWFLSPIPPRGATVGMAMSASLKNAIANPNDKPAEAYKK